MTNPIAPSALYLGLQDQLGEIHDLARTLVSTTAEWKRHDPNTLKADNLGDPTTGPETYKAVLHGLEIIDTALNATDAAYRNVLTDAGRLCAED